MGEVIDFSALTWVRQGLDETLAQARDTLESYSSDPDDVAPLRACIASLHQVKGTLTMMETHAAADLAGEMETTARALLDKQIKTPADAFESIMRAILQLPDYLEWLQSGKQDQPQLLAPLRNDLRKARGLAPEAPSASAGKKPIKTLPDAAVRKVAQQTRTVFQSGLIGLVKGDVSEQFSKRICISLGNLERACLTPNVNRVWVLASGVLEAVTQGGLETSLAVKKLFGQLDREIKRLADSGEQALAETPNLELIDALEGLVQAATAGGRKLESAQGLLKEPGSTDSASKQGTDDLILGEGGGLSGVNTQVLETVSGALREDLASIKDSLDIFTRSEERNLKDLLKLREPLRKIADTLQMIGLKHPYSVIMDLSSLIDEAAQGQVTLHDYSLLEMATAVLFVESSLNGLAEGRKESEGDADEVIESLERVRHMAPDEKPPVTQSALPDSEFQQVAAAVVREANIDLAKSKDAIVAFIATPFDETILADIPQSYEQVYGALSLLGMSRAANQLEAVKTYIDRRLLGNKSLPDRDHLDRLAEAISAIEYYLESVTQQRMDTSAILDMADQCLADLGYPFEDLEAEAESPAEFLDESHLELPELDDLDAAHDGDTRQDSEDTALAPDEPEALSEQGSGPESLAEAGDAPQDIPVTEANDTAQPKQADHDGIPDEDLKAFMPEDKPAEADYNAPSESSAEHQDKLNGEHSGGATLAAGGLIAAAMGASALAGDQSLEDDQSPADNAPDTDEVPSEAIELSAVESELDSEADVPAEPESDTGSFDHAARHVLNLHSNDEPAPEDDVPEFDLSEIALDEEEDHFAAFQTDSDPETDERISLHEPFADLPSEETAADATQIASAAAEDEADIPDLPSEQDTESAQTANSGLHEPSETDASSDQEAPPVLETAAEVEPDAATTSLEAAFSYGLPILDEDYDPDILEIYIEEAQEELESIQQRLPDWLASDDAGALADVRRSYHTLKGSGRMAGAKKLGEYAWAFESLFNAVIEDQVAADERLRSVVEEGSGDTLAALVAQLEDQSLPTPERADLLCLRAQALKDPQVPYPDEQAAEPPTGSSDATEDATAEVDDSPSVPEGVITDDTTGPDTALAPEAIAATVATAVTAGSLVSDQGDAKADETTQIAGDEEALDSPAAEDADPEGIDPVLFDIFSNETYGHLDTLNHVVDEGHQQAGPDRDANDNLRRALHTILGSARTAGITEIADLAGPLDHYIKDIHTNNERLSDDDLSLLSDSEQIIRTLVEAYPDQAGHAGDIDTLLNHISSSFTARSQARQDREAARKLEQEEFDAQWEDEESNPTKDTPHSADSDQSEGAMLRDEGAEDVVVQDDSDIIPAPEDPAPEDPAPEITPVSQDDAPTSDSATDTFFQVEADPDLLEIFLEEGAEILDAAEGDLARLQSDSTDPAALQSLQRAVHTLKGGARMCGITPIGDLSHSLENLFNLLVEGQTETTNQSFDLLTRCFDRLVQMTEQVQNENRLLPADHLIAQVDALVSGEPLPDEASQEPLQPVDSSEDKKATDSKVSHGDSPPGDSRPTGATSEPTPKTTPEIATETATPATDHHAHDTVRVRADSMTSMINLAGEVSIFRSRLEQQMGSFQFNIAELDATVNRIREQLRKLEIETEAQILSRYQAATPDDNTEFDPLEMDRFSQVQQLSRALVEGVNDLTSIQDALDSHTREAETLLLQQSRINTELQEGLMSTRMVPFKGIVPRLARIVRQTSRELGIKVDLKLVGDNEEIDRTILDRMTAPLEHTVRNAISHGIETPKERQAAGKPETGEISLELGREGSEVVIRIRDDGRGIDLDKLHRKALDMGLLTKTDEVPDQDLVQLVLESGVSTASEVSQIAGRGVGMDVVSSEVRQLGGTLNIHTEQGKGTEFTVRLPFTLSMNQALLVEIGDDPYAVPLAALDGVIRLSPAELAKSYGSDTPLYEYAGNSYKLMHLGALLGINLPVVTDAESKIPILLVRAGDQRVALQVDRLIGSREIVVKSLGIQLSTVPGIAGATILGDGSVVLILELGALVRIGATSHTDKVFEVTEEQQRQEPHISVMVVDDSITMRKVATRLLERHNMHVETAKDGLDALAKLQDIVPDVMLLDIEMPRMDGFELASHMRRDERWKDVPIIMITSRTGDKHRDRAMEIGVNHYMGKPYKENDLLNTIQKAVGRSNVGGITHG